jgi:ubiquinone/menaquinone biosynthesis C-methylase UbiE
MKDASTRQAAAYDLRYAGDYMDTDAYTLWGHDEQRIRQVLDTLNLVKCRPGRILDYGCGVGSWVPILTRAFSAAKLCGIDISTKAIERARTRFPQHRFQVFDGNRAPFAEETFDLVFSYHVLEHVADIDSAIGDISRLLVPGGYAVVIFPCGNEGSFLDRTMRLLRDSVVETPDGRTALFFEVNDGHLRRMTSRETISIFERNGLEPVAQMFSGHFFGAIDWLCRGTGPSYINTILASKQPVGRVAAVRVALTRRCLLGLHRLIKKKSIDLVKKRPWPKQAAAFTIQNLATLVEELLLLLCRIEWRLLRNRKHGSAQFLVFCKNATSATSATAPLPDRIR